MFKIFKKRKIEPENYKSNQFLNEQWIEHYFILKMIKPVQQEETQFMKELEIIHDKILSFILIDSYGTININKSIAIKSYNSKYLPEEYGRALKFTESNENTFFILIRFPDLKKGDSKKELIFRKNSPDEKRNYKFSPIQSLEMPEILKKIKFKIGLIFNLKPNQLMTLVTGVDQEVIIHNFDGIQYFSYPLSKEAELYFKYPEIYKKIFSMDFKKFCNWIIDKENDSPEMKRNVERTRQILSKYS